MDPERQFDTSHLEFKLKRLNSDIHNPCYLLHLRDVNVLLDCCIETSALVHFLPSHQLLTPGCSDLPVPTHENVSVVEKSHTTSVPATQDDCQVTIGDNIYLRSKPQFCLMNKTEFSSVIWDAVDVILVSNTNSILGLPFICSATNFRGRILATEPVVKFGKVLMEDLLDALEQLPPCRRYPVEQLKQDPKQPRSFLHDFLGSNDRVWKEFYSRQTIKDTLDRIQLVAYHEPVDIFGLLTICGSSAGFGIGSCNWTLTSPTEKVAYISHTSLLYSHVLAPVGGPRDLSPVGLGGERVVAPETYRGEIAQRLERERTDRKVRPLPLDFPCLGLGNLAVSQPSCFLWVAWQLGTERVLQLNDYNAAASLSEI
ncbi:Integrator complex subunit 9 [Clonorchis sinensis]|uniref:Integrator complex subunit 9 n=1 Tax=Clonorchis sinensis TaxID=79923 RepID=A0A8T1MZQ3_CLOSI|nr:Integrator complex subunit 9 [Clonorchis sinensis]